MEAITSPRKVYFPGSGSERREKTNGTHFCKGLLLSLNPPTFLRPLHPFPPRFLAEPAFHRGVSFRFVSFRGPEHRIASPMRVLHNDHFSRSEKVVKAARIGGGGGCGCELATERANRFPERSKGDRSRSRRGREFTAFIRDNGRYKSAREGAAETPARHGTARNKKVRRTRRADGDGGKGGRNTRQRV